MKRICIAIGLFLYTTPLVAQTNAELLERIARLEMVIGDIQRRCAEQLGDTVRPQELPNREYPVMYRQCQLGSAADAAYTQTLPGFQAQISGIAARLAVVESRPANTTLAGTIHADKLILGTCERTDQAAQLSICGNDASIYNESNADGAQYQNQSRHYGQWGMSSDGGMRILQNQYQSVNCVPATDPTNGVQFSDCMKRFVDPTRETGMFGPDSRAQWSWHVAKPGIPHEYTQDLVLRTYEDQKVLTLESWRPGWTIKFATSSGFRTIDRWYTLPQQ